MSTLLSRSMSSPKGEARGRAQEEPNGPKDKTKWFTWRDREDFHHDSPHFKVRFCILGRGNMCHCMPVGVRGQLWVGCPLLLPCGIEFRSAGLTARAFARWATLPDPLLPFFYSFPIFVQPFPFNGAKWERAQATMGTRTQRGDVRFQYPHSYSCDVRSPSLESKSTGVHTEQMASWRGLSATETSDQPQKKSQPQLSLSNKDPRTRGWVLGEVFRPQKLNQRLSIPGAEMCQAAHIWPSQGFKLQQRVHWASCVRRRVDGRALAGEACLSFLRE